MKTRPTAIEGVLVLEPDVHRDSRGWFVETWRQDVFDGLGLPRFLQDNWSRSERDVLRGMHYEVSDPQDQLVRVSHGAILDVVVDLRPGSPTFGRWHAEELSDANARQVFMPGGIAHGFLVLSDSADVHYKCSHTWRGGNEAGLVWNDPAVGIDWPCRAPIVKDRDAAFPQLADIPADRLPRIGVKAGGC